MISTLLKTPSLDSPLIHHCPNGLTIIAQQMPIEAVNLNVWLNVGSVVEADQINGMAHFLEHMMFKGTPSLKSGEFEKLVEERGAVANAATSQEYTHYYITTAPQDFAVLAPLQLDIVLNPSIPEEAFERERFVVLEEIRRAEDNPRRRIFYRAMETCFDTLPYRRPVLGSASVIEGLKAQQMREFHRYWYQPAQMTAVVVGNLPVNHLIDIVNDGMNPSACSLSRHPNQQFSRLEPSFTPEPSFTKIIRRDYTDESLQQARLVMMWRVPGLQQLNDTYGLDVLAVILGQGKMSRLFRDLREDRGLVSSITASNMTQGVQGIFYVSAQLPTEHLAEVETAILQHLRHIQVESVTETELNRIRTQVANRFIFSNERPSDRANLYGYYYSHLQTLEPALTYPQSIQALTPDDIQLAAQQYLSLYAYAIVTMKPQADQE